MYDHAKIAYQTADGMVRKTKQVVMLYDGMIGFTQRALDAVQRKDVETRYNMISRTCEIANGLQLSLDLDKGGEVASLLDDFYSGLSVRLRSVHRSGDASMLEASIGHLKQMRDAWVAVDQEYATQNDESVSDEEIYKNERLRSALTSGQSGLDALEAISVSV